MSVKNKLWVEKYRPKNVSEYLFQSPLHKKIISNILQTGNLPHLLLSGVQGTGKTSLYKILLNELNIDSCDVKKINASDDNSVDVMRDSIKSFITTEPISSPFKVVVLEEASYLTVNAQEVLKDYMEAYSDTVRFILTCNYESKILPAIKSRCQHLQFKNSDEDKVLELCGKILIKENVKFDLEILEQHVNNFFPDIRKTLNSLQQSSSDGQLNPLKASGDSNYKLTVLNYICSGDWNQARILAASNTAMNEWEELYRFLYENIGNDKKFKKNELYAQAITIIAEYLYRNSTVASQEINFSACAIALTSIE